MVIHSPQNIAITCSENNLNQQARALATNLNLPFIAHEINYQTNINKNQYAFVLSLTPTGLALQQTDEPKSKPLYLDFLSGKINYRSTKASLKNELIAKAMGCKPNTKPCIFDITAGLGRDSFILASLGFEITLVEKSPILYALLNDALSRAKHHPACERLTLIRDDSIHYLTSCTQYPDIIYYDPMFPKREKSAQVKKEMLMLQKLLGSENDPIPLFNLALTCAKRRVVVKRPRLASTINDLKPHFSLTGKSSRFDIYLTQPQDSG